MSVRVEARWRYLDDADGLPGEVEAGVEQEGEDEGERSVPAQRKHKGVALRLQASQRLQTS